MAVSSSNRIGNVVSGSRYILRFKDVRDSDLAAYACRAANVLGKADATVEMSGKSAEKSDHSDDFIRNAELSQGGPSRPCCEWRRHATVTDWRRKGTPSV